MYKFYWSVIIYKKFCREFICVNYDFINENVLKKFDDKKRMKEFLYYKYVSKKKLGIEKKIYIVYVL